MKIFYNKEQKRIAKRLRKFGLGWLDSISLSKQIIGVSEDFSESKKVNKHSMGLMFLMSLVWNDEQREAIINNENN